MKKSVFLFILFNAAVTSHAQTVSTDTVRGKSKTVSIGPANFHFSLSQGQTGKHVLKIVNNRDKPYLINLRAGNWDIDSLGTSIHYDTTTFPQSCARWLSFDKTFLQVMPGKTEEVVVTLRMPKTAEAFAEMKWCTIIATLGGEKLPPQQSQKAAAVLTQRVSIVMHVYQTPPTLDLKEMSLIGLDYDEAKRKLAVVSENRGEVSLRCNYTVELASVVTGKKIAVQVPEKVLVLPNHKRIVELDLPEGIEKGTYVAIATIDAEDDDVPIEAGQREIVIQ